jgi:predicted RNA-binding Zn ribbon-like protein
VEQRGGAQRSFDLSGGALCLDFANTLDDRPDPRPNESLESYADLLAFSQQAGSLPEAHLTRLLAESMRRPADAAVALDCARVLREMIYRAFLALSDGEAVAAADLEALNRSLGAALAQARVASVDDAVHHDRPVRFAWAWTADPIDLEAPLWPVVRSAADLLTSPDLPSLRLCAANACAWLFLDTSRNGSRRWCSMRTCGNRAKARRHHARVRAASAAAGE